MSSNALAYPPASVVELPGDPSKSSSIPTSMSARHVAGVPAAVDEDLGPGHVGGVVGGQEGDDLGHFGDLRRPLHGDLVDDGAEVDVAQRAQVGFEHHR